MVRLPPQKDMKHSASFRSENPKKDYESSPTDRFLGDGNSYRYSALRSDQQQTVSTPSKTKGTSERATIPSEMKPMTTNKSIEKLPSASVFQSDEKAQPDSNDRSCEHITQVLILQGKVERPRTKSAAINRSQT